MLIVSVVYYNGFTSSRYAITKETCSLATPVFALSAHWVADIAYQESLAGGELGLWPILLTVNIEKVFVAD